jgi:hypothetical protein
LSLPALHYYVAVFFSTSTGRDKPCPYKYSFVALSIVLVALILDTLYTVARQPKRENYF